MTLSIIAILAALIPLLVWFIRRQAARRDDPLNQKEKRHEEISRQIIHDDETAANRTLDDDLRRLHSLQGHQQRQDNPPDQG